LDGLEAVELKLSEVLDDNNSFRFDSEYFKKEYIDISKHIHTFEHDKLGDFTKVTDGEHGSVEFIDNGIKYLTAENIKKGFVDISNIRYVSKEVDLRNKRASVEIDDILISIKGTLGEVAIAEPWLLPANMNRDVAIIKNILKAKYFSDYITIFLMSNMGKKLSEREGSGGVQQMITLERLRSILIPKLNNVLQNKISELYKLSRRKLQESKILYKQAEELLLKELDLLKFKPSEENIAIKSFKESFGTSGRLDSEYYQPKYDEIIDKIKSYKGGFEKLQNLTKNYSGGYAFSSDDYLENGELALIRINNIKNGYLDLSNAVFLPDDHKNLSKKDIVKEDDILISMSGSIGLSCKIEKNINAMTNQRILKIEIEGFKSDVLVLILNSIISSMQLERIGTGGVQINISSSDILNLIIPSIDETIQTQIEEKIKKSFELKEASKQLLDLAKKAVEVAIEKDEDEAMEFTNA